MLPIAVTVVGAGAARPRAGAPASCLHVASGGTRILLDCGEGTQVALDELSLSIGKLDAVCVTHMHGDHVFGLPGLLSSMGLEGRTRRLSILGPPPLQAFVEQVLGAAGGHALPFPLDYRTADAAAPQSDVLAFRELSVATLPLRHRVRCVGFCVSATAEGRHLRPGVVEAYGIPYAQIPALRAGADFTPDEGAPVPNALLTTAPDPPRTVAYLTDTAPLSTWPASWPSPTLLVHDATFAAADEALARDTGHSTVTQAAAFAKTCHATQLLLTHVSIRYPNRDALLAEAQSVFAKADLARPGARVTLN